MPDVLTRSVTGMLGTIGHLQLGSPKKSGGYGNDLLNRFRFRADENLKRADPARAAALEARFRFLFQDEQDAKDPWPTARRLHVSTIAPFVESWEGRQGTAWAARQQWVSSAKTRRAVHTCDGQWLLAHAPDGTWTYDRTPTGQRIPCPSATEIARWHDGEPFNKDAIICSPVRQVFLQLPDFFVEDPEHDWPGEMGVVTLHLSGVYSTVSVWNTLTAWDGYLRGLRFILSRQVEQKSGSFMVGGARVPTLKEIGVARLDVHPDIADRVGRAIRALGVVPVGELPMLPRPTETVAEEVYEAEYVTLTDDDPPTPDAPPSARVVPTCAVCDAIITGTASSRDPGKWLSPTEVVAWTQATYGEPLCADHARERFNATPHPA